MSDYARKYPLTKKNIMLDLHRKILCAWRVYMRDSWKQKKKHRSACQDIIGQPKKDQGLKYQVSNFLID
jgi:hypothetical protein